MHCLYSAHEGLPCVVAMTFSQDCRPLSSLIVHIAAGVFSARGILLSGGQLDADKIPFAIINDGKR